jgi:hypothetical protein
MTYPPAGWHGFEDPGMFLNEFCPFRKFSYDALTRERSPLK